MIRLSGSTSCETERPVTSSRTSVDELPPGTRKFLTIDERPIAIFNVKGEFFGLLNRCPHRGAALCEGPLIGLARSAELPARSHATRLGEILRCPWHGWEFDIRTGQSYCDPKKFRARAYAGRRGARAPPW